jgi:uncharacterized protein involved in exopolysaccharide biosynthesis
MAQDPSEVRQAIEQDRDELAETVQALARKADVKGRIRETLSRSSNQLQHTATDLASKVREVSPDQVPSGLGSAAKSVRQRPIPLGVALGFCFGLLLGRLWRRNR